MYAFFIVLTVIVAILLIGIVLIQKSKGGGLSSQFSSANAVMGVRSTNSNIEKTTWVLAGLIVLLSVVSSFLMPGVSNGVVIRTKTQTEVPAAPANQFDTQIPVAPAAEAPAASEAPAAAEEAAAE